MLTELVVQNLIIVAQARLCPGRGLTVISGETGAGKSLVLDAVGLLSGDRAQGRLVGPHGDAVTVSAVFQVDADVAARVESACGVGAQDGQFILRRRIGANGRSQAWINDLPLTLAAMKAAADQLVEIRAQHEAQRLGDPSRQLELLDGYAGLVDRAADYRAAHQRVLDLQRQLTELVEGRRDSLKELDFLRFQSREFAALAPQPGELARLEARQALLAGAEEWRGRATEAAELLAEGERSVTQALAALARRLAEAPDPRLAEAGKECAQALELARDAAAACLDAQDRLQGDPAELARVQERLNAWNELMRKHGDGEAAILAAWRTVDERIAVLADLEGRQARLQADLTAALAERGRLGAALAQARAKAFTRLAKAVEQQLTELGMTKTKLSLTQEELTEPSAGGTVRQEFLVATNPGLPAGRLAEVTSGGEAARLSLALAVVLAESDRTPVLIFDEVDSGVGGRLGAAIGAKLADLARNRTVIVVTHTPQLAAVAQRHYAVRKLQGKLTTMVEVEEIADGKRLTELAEMLGGGAAALGQAKALLAGAKRYHYGAKSSFLPKISCRSGTGGAGGEAPLLRLPASAPGGSRPEGREAARGILPCSPCSNSTQPGGAENGTFGSGGAGL